MQATTPSAAMRDTTHEATLLIRKRRRPTAEPLPPSSRFQIEIPTDLLRDFGLTAAEGASKVIHCKRAA